jgi:hypothetical protein
MLACADFLLSSIEIQFVRFGFHFDMIVDLRSEKAPFCLAACDLGRAQSLRIIVGSDSSVDTRTSALSSNFWNLFPFLTLG